MIGPLRQTMTKGLASFAAWAYEVVDALGRCWFLLFATLFVGVTILDGLLTLLDRIRPHEPANGKI